MKKTVEEEQTNKDCKAFEDVVYLLQLVKLKIKLYSISFQIQKIESFH
jgi:hypothetical protein